MKFPNSYSYDIAKFTNYKLFLSSIIFIVTFFILLPPSIYSQTSITESNNIINNDDIETLFVIFVNFERINSQLDLAEMYLDSNDRDNAFMQAYIPHKTTYPSIKSDVQAIDNDLSTEIEDLLTVLPILITDINTPNVEIKDKINEIRNLISKYYNNNLQNIITNDSFNIQSAVVLLRDFNTLHNTLNVKFH